MKPVAMIVGLAALFFTFTSSADVGHDQGASDKFGAPLWVWGVGLGVLAVVSLALFVQARRGKLIGEGFRGFSRNAKLLLIRSPFSGLSVSLIRLLFNLYLLAVGFDTLFVAKFNGRPHMPQVRRRASSAPAAG